MRSWIIVCALAAFGASATAQVGAGTAGSTAAPAAPARTIDSLRLSRRQAIIEALQRNPQLDVAREQTAQARARRVQALAIPDPALSASIDNQPGLFALGGNGTSRNVTVGLDVPFPDKIRLQGNVAAGDVRASQENFRLTQQTVAFATSQAYDDLLLALRHRADLLQARELAADFLKRTQARFNAGTVPRLDVIKATVEVAQADNDLIANERDVATAQAALNRMLGRVLGAPIAPTDTLELPAALPDSAAIERLAVENRPELASVASLQAGARANTSLQREFWLPDLTMGMTRDNSVGSGALFTTGLALPIPIFFWQHTRGEIAEAKHRERELAATYTDTRAQVIQDVRSAYANASTAMRQVIFLRDELVPAARDAYRVASTSYSLGGSSALEVIDARRALLDAENQLAEALAAASTARADLERALGTSVPTMGGRNQ